MNEIQEKPAHNNLAKLYWLDTRKSPVISFVNQPEIALPVSTSKNLLVTKSI